MVVKDQDINIRGLENYVVQVEEELKENPGVRVNWRVLGN